MPISCMGVPHFGHMTGPTSSMSNRGMYLAAFLALSIFFSAYRRSRSHRFWGGCRWAGLSQVYWAYWLWGLSGTRTARFCVAYCSRRSLCSPIRFAWCSLLSIGYDPLHGLAYRVHEDSSVAHDSSPVWVVALQVLWRPCGDALRRVGFWLASQPIHPHVFAAVCAYAALAG